MSRAWGSDAFLGATSVPMWTRPSTAGFVAFADGTPCGFAPWTQEPEAPAIRDEEEPAPDIAAAEFARGFDAGVAAAEAATATEQAATLRIAAALEALRPQPAADLGAMLAATVERLVGQILGEVEIDRPRLLARAEAAAALIDEGAAARLRLHPADLARLGEAPLATIADPTLAEGTIVAETAEGWIEDAPGARLARLRARLDALAQAR